MRGMYLKVHENNGGKIVAVCDEDLIGKTFQEGDAILDLDKYKTFYHGKKVEDEEIKNAFKSFSSANIVGKKSISLAISAGLISKDDVLHVKGVPYVQIYNI